MNETNLIAIISLSIAIVCALIIIVDLLAGHKQHMWIMNIVWPITALYSGPLGLIAYYTIGRKSSHSKMMERHHHHPTKPFWQSVLVGALHCGSGCTLGDMLAEIFLSAVPVVLFGMHIFGSWAVDFIFAFLIGIIFQYFSITPMRHLTPKEGIIAALKADTLSLTSWQIGMYGWMAIAAFGIYGHELSSTTPLFWFMMQIAMLLGLITAYPVNWWLLKKGIKEVM